MITIQNYVKVKDLEEAYELNQKKANRIAGGMMWLRMSKGRVQTAIDLSELGLDEIEEDEKEFRIGCMATLRQLETHDGLERCFEGAVKESVRHIVGTQFRNGATVGGSIFGRFGFSDVLTCFLAMDSYVELYKGGVVPLRKFVNMERDRDILVRLIVKKDGRNIAYLSERACSTDFPIIACAVSVSGDDIEVAVGARPMKADVVTMKGMAKAVREAGADDREEIEAASREAAESFGFGSNMRGSAKYRKHLTYVLAKRGMTKLLKGEE